MTFASTITDRGMMGNKLIRWGTWTNAGGDTGGNVETELNICEGMLLQTSGNAVSADQSSVNETLPIDGSAITIKTTDGADGYWFAWGH